MTHSILWQRLGAVGIVASTLLSASPVFDNSRANAWLLDEQTGQMASSLTLSGGGWSTLASDAGGGNVNVQFDGGGSQTVNLVDLTKQSVLVNTLEGSLPAPVFSGAVSLSGLDIGSGSADGTIPEAYIEPASGVHDGTVKVTLRAVPSRSADPAGTTADFTWWINGTRMNKTVAWDAESGFVTSFYLYKDGSYTIDFRVGYNGATANATRSVIAISGSDPIRDSDGDGVPDSWEIEHGLDPFSDNIANDSDGDGWSDFDEALRGSDPNSAGDMPLDSDNDGWSDFDEEQLRQTNKNDLLKYDAVQFPWVDRPSATRLYEVEYLLHGPISKQDKSGPFVDTKTLSILDTQWKTLYANDELPDEETIEAYDSSYTMSDLPVRFQASVAEGNLQHGGLPLGLRVPAGNPFVVYAVENNDSRVSKWAAKAWVDSTDDLLPDVVLPELTEENGYGWKSASEWEAAYIQYLRDHLVISKETLVSPSTSLDVALMEAVIDWVDGEQNGPMVLLGDRTSRKASGATAVMRNRLDINSSTLNALHAHLFYDMKNGYFDPFVTQGEALFSPDANLTNLATTTHGLAAILQKSDHNASLPVTYDDEAVYRARLQFSIEPKLLHEIDARLLDPADDFDSDLVPNRLEMMQPYALFSTPQSVDSDGDGLVDINDPCPADSSNVCVMETDLHNDSDGDGVEDFLDNCLNVANADQQDSDGNGFGDACNANFHIRRPTTNLTLLSGMAVYLEGVQTGGSYSDLSYEWDLNGSVVATGLAPGMTALGGNGVYQLGFTAFESGTPVYSEYRTVHLMVMNATAPLANDDVFYVASAATLSVGASAGVLANDNDGDEDPLTAVLVSAPAHAASFALNADGSFTYTRDGTYVEDSFTYRAYDGKDYSGTATVYLHRYDYDSDGDGMPDTYELQYPGYLDPAVADAALDADGDGFDNGTEYREGTDPSDPNDHPEHPPVMAPIIMYLLD